MPTKIEKDDVSGRETTGHEWDGLKELNTPLPRWWLYVFVATIVWGLGYTVFYPAWPTPGGHTPGILGWWSRAELQERLDEAARQRAPQLGKIVAAPLAEIRADRALLDLAVAGGRVAFAENCAPCHAAGGAGRAGYPALADDVWLWGGRLEDIDATIRFGVRNAHDRSRQSQMPRFGVDGILTGAQIGDVAEHVLSLSGRSQDPARAARGAKIYAEQCAACHGESGKGNREFGAPRLDGQVWLYGGSRDAIVSSIAESRAGAMPAWVGRLDEATLKMLAVYVHALGGGE